jgi:hypothetical protein
MAIIDQKREVFGAIGALNVLNDNFPKLPSFNSFSSVNNGTDSTQFLIDLIQSLIGFEGLKGFVVDTISYRLEDIEAQIKDGLKSELKEIVSCNINPSIPSWLQNGGSGVQVKVSDVDFFDIMKIDPETTEGDLVYTDVSGGKNSKDFNTYLNYKIQDPGSTDNWGTSTFGSNILETEFIEDNGTNTNIIKFTASAEYSDKKLTQLNNDFIDSISLFGNPDSLNSASLISALLEDLFGSTSASINVGKSKKQLKKEVELREVLDCIINSENEVIDDNFFTFDNPTLAAIEEDVNQRKNGIRILETCGNLAVQVDVNDSTEAVDKVKNSSNKSEEVKNVGEALDDIADKQGAFSNNSIDVPTIRKNFFIELIKKFIRIMTSLFLSPKIISLFAINHQIIYGQGTSYDGAIDFIKKNKKLVKNVIKIIRNILLNLLLALALRELSKKLAEKVAGDEIEKAKNYTSILLSYVGVPPAVLAVIRGI